MRIVRMCRMLLLAGVCASLVVPALALNPETLQDVATNYRDKVFMLKVSMREPVVVGDFIQAPMLDAKGWHFVNQSKEILLLSGSRVEVTGVFNYSERGFFVELATESTGFFHRPVSERPRLRIRLMVETPPDNPNAQATEAAKLLEKLLAPTNAP